MEFRTKVLDAAVRGYVRMVEAEHKGEGQINRSDKSSRTVRRWTKLVGKTTWFKGKRFKESGKGAPTAGNRRQNSNPEVEGVIYVPYTQGSQLKRRLQEAEDKALGNKLTGRVRVLERMGTTVKDSIANPTPWKREPCGRKCKICLNSPGACKSRGVVYEIHCKVCKDKGLKSLYIGETHRTLWDRTSEHLSKLESRAKDSALLKHWRTVHPENHQEPDFIVKKVGAYLSSTERQIREAIRIDMAQYDHLMNSKGEWGQNAIPRQRTTLNDELWEKPNPGKDNQDEQQGGANPPNGDKKRVPPPEGLFEQQYSQRRKRIREEKRDERAEQQRAQVGDAGQENRRPPQRLKNSGSRLGAPPEQHGHGQEDGPQQSQPENTGPQKKEKRREFPERQDCT